MKKQARDIAFVSLLFFWSMKMILDTLDFAIVCIYLIVPFALGARDQCNHATLNLGNSALGY